MNSLLPRFTILFRGMVRILGWEDYSCVVDGPSMLVGADGDYFRNGREPFVTIVLFFMGKLFGLHGEDKG